MAILVYVGNFLEGAGLTASPNVHLVQAWGKRHRVDTYGKSKGKWSRGVEMIQGALSATKGSKILIDVYSTQAFWFAALTACACKIKGLDYYLILHGGDLPNRFARWPRVSNWLLKGASAVVTPSEYLQVATQQAFGLQTQVIRNPLVLTQYPFVERNFEQIKLLWVRSLHPLYHPEMALQVVSRLHQFGIMADLVMVGPDKHNMRPDLEKLAESLGIAKSLEFTGKLDRADWILQAAERTIFLNTTHFDNAPVSVVEAMALGLPVVSTNVGGIPFLLNQDRSWLVQDGNVSEMVAAIQEIVNHPQATKEKVRKAREWVESEFALDAVMKEWDSVLHIG
jgi:glycosyltransferase involved in cell wall biosynthesis